MDNKLKWGGALCAFVLCFGLYVDNKPAAPIDFENPATLRYRNILRHANRDVAAAQYVLGTFYQRGHPEDRIAQDTVKAQEWFKRAADNAHFRAAFEYARLVAPSNPGEAEKYYRQAMAKGFTAAIFGLAQLKLREGTPGSIKEGLELLYAATKASDPMAQAYLATLLYEGAGIKKDRVSAVLTMQQAAANAPTPETKKDWDEKHSKWFSELSDKEQNELREKLMLASQQSPKEMLGPSALSEVDLSSLLANRPIDGSKAVAK